MGVNDEGAEEGEEEAAVAEASSIGS